MTAPTVLLNARWGGKIRDQNIDMSSGDDLLLFVTTTSVGEAVLDLTGGVLTWVLSKVPGSTALITKTGDLTFATSGVFSVSVDGTEDLSGDYYHEAQFTDTDDNVGTVMRGWVKIRKDSA